MITLRDDRSFAIRSLRFIAFNRGIQMHPFCHSLRVGNSIRAILLTTICASAALGVPVPVPGTPLEVKIEVLPEPCQKNAWFLYNQQGASLVSSDLQHCAHFEEAGFKGRQLVIDDVPGPTVDDEIWGGLSSLCLLTEGERSHEEAARFRRAGGTIMATPDFSRVGYLAKVKGQKFLFVQEGKTVTKVRYDAPVKDEWRAAGLAPKTLQIVYHKLETDSRGHSRLVLRIGEDGKTINADINLQSGIVFSLNGSCYMTGTDYASSTRAMFLNGTKIFDHSGGQELCYGYDGHFIAQYSKPSGPNSEARGYAIVSDKGQTDMMEQPVHLSIAAGGHTTYALEVKATHEWRYIVDGKATEAYQSLYSVAFSPDGNHYAFVVKQDGKTGVILDGGEPKRSPEFRGGLLVSTAGTVAYRIEGGWYVDGTTVPFHIELSADSFTRFLPSGGFFVGFNNANEGVRLQVGEDVYVLGGVKELWNLKFDKDNAFTAVGYATNGKAITLSGSLPPAK